MLDVLSYCLTVIAVAGVVLCNRRRRECFLLWMVSNTGSLLLHLLAALGRTPGMWGLVLRDAIFLALAVEGWILWTRKEGC